MAVSGSFLDLAEWAARTARFDVSDTADMTLAKAAVNDAYLSSCGDGSPWDFLQREGQWLPTAGSDTYSYDSITTAMSLTGGTIAEVHRLINDTDGEPLESMSWEALELYAASSQDDPSGTPCFWSKWDTRIRLWPTPDADYTLGTFCRVIPTEMSDDADEPFIPMQWRRRLLVPYAAAVLIRTEGGLEAQAEASRLMEAYDADYIKFRTAHATAKKPTFRVSTPGWDATDPLDYAGWSSL